LGPLPLVAFENANLVPMHNARVFHDRVVVVQGSRIVDVGRKNAVKIPSGAPVIWERVT
jgi:imidazolonepropionase-like amidohydrolase